VKSLQSPDEVLRLPGITEELVDLGDLTVGRVMHEPGWRWSTHVRPVVGGEWCQARHVGVVISGVLGFLMQSGTEYTLRPYDAYDMPGGHDGYIIGDEPAIALEWAGLRTIAGRQRTGASNRVVATLLFTDLVESTAQATVLGDVAWRERLAGHLEASRDAVERFGGQVVTTTGDGLLATFNAPAVALPCAGEICRRATGDGLQVRAGVHVGEVDVVGRSVRGVAVHEAARIIALAGPGEILASEVTMNLASASGFIFEDRGTHALKGLQGERRLFSYAGPVASSTGAS
jgi:class 3 adenylate cyclase